MIENDLFCVIYLFQNDQTHALDTENLGNGTVVTFLIIPPVILLSYVLDGRYEIQSIPFFLLLKLGLHHQRKRGPQNQTSIRDLVDLGLSLIPQIIPSFDV